MARRSIADKRVIVTGASSGIGRQLAIQLARANARLVVCARRESMLQQLVDEIEQSGGICSGCVGDVTCPAFRDALISTCVKNFGGLDIVINNAGITAMGRFDLAIPERLRDVFEVNFFAAAELIRVALPQLKQGDDPMVVNIGSVLGHRAAPLKSEYSASKFALHGLSDALRAELAPSGIELLMVSPSTTDSQLFDQAIDDTTHRNWKSGTATAPEVVARKTIQAMIKRRHEIILTAGGKMLVWVDRMLPWLADRLVARYGQ